MRTQSWLGKRDKKLSFGGQVSYKYFVNTCIELRDISGKVIFCLPTSGVMKTCYCKMHLTLLSQKVFI